jgi:hypothetical protein
MARRKDQARARSDRAGERKAWAQRFPKGSDEDREAAGSNRLFKAHPSVAKAQASRERRREPKHSSASTHRRHRVRGETMTSCPDRASGRFVRNAQKLATPARPLARPHARRDPTLGRVPNGRGNLISLTIGLAVAGQGGVRVSPAARADGRANNGGMCDENASGLCETRPVASARHCDCPASRQRPAA